MNPLFSIVHNALCVRSNMYVLYVYQTDQKCVKQKVIPISNGLFDFQTLWKIVAVSTCIAEK